MLKTVSLVPSTDNLLSTQNALVKIGSLPHGIQPVSIFDVHFQGASMGVAKTGQKEGKQFVELYLQDWAREYLQEDSSSLLNGIRRSLQDGEIVFLHVDTQYEVLFQTSGWNKQEKGWSASSISKDFCVWCNKRPATEKFTHSALDFTHGSYQNVCEICLLEKQIDFAQSAAERLPKLKTQLQSLLQQEVI